MSDHHPSLATPYRTHTCGELRATDAGTTVRLSGWVHRRRDHGFELLRVLAGVYRRDARGNRRNRVDALVCVRECIVVRFAPLGLLRK